MPNFLHHFFETTWESGVLYYIFCAILLFIGYLWITRIYSLVWWKIGLQTKEKNQNQKTTPRSDNNKNISPPNWVPHNFLEHYQLLHWKTTPSQYLMSLSAIGILILFLGYLSGYTLWLTLSASILSIWFGYGFVFLKAREQRKKLIEQMPLFLQSLSNAMQAGFSLSQALDFIARELDDPLQTEILKCTQMLGLQVPLPTVLSEFANRMQNKDIDFVCDSTIIQLKTGGNLITLFQRTADIMEAKLKLERDIKSFTSQGKMSGYLMGGLWPASLLIFTWLSPQHTAVLFETTPGKTLLIFSLCLEIMGFWWVWRIIKVKI